MKQHKELFILKLVFATFFFIFFLFFNQGQIQGNKQNPEAKNQVLGIGSQNESKGLPVRLIIPSINVDATIEEVGITPKGLMDVPKKTTNGGWFKFGPPPGERGSAVIAGHFNGIYGEDAVFTNLNKLVKGDKVFVEDSNGKITTFVVQKSSVFDPGYVEDVFSRNDGAHLNLITCDGVWDGVEKSFNKRLVVFTDLIF